VVSGARIRIRLNTTVAVLGGEYVLIATGDHSVFAPQSYSEFAVTSNASGEVTGLEFRGTNAFTIPKVR
jgi:hypothetical protein